jgi:hypothetical protein
MLALVLVAAGPGWAVLCLFMGVAVPIAIALVLRRFGQRRFAAEDCSFLASFPAARDGGADSDLAPGRIRGNSKTIEWVPRDSSLSAVSIPVEDVVRTTIQSAGLGLGSQVVIYRRAEEEGLRFLAGVSPRTVRRSLGAIGDESGAHLLG